STAGEVSRPDRAVLPGRLEPRGGGQAASVAGRHGQDTSLAWARAVASPAGSRRGVRRGTASGRATDGGASECGRVGGAGRGRVFARSCVFGGSHFGFISRTGGRSRSAHGPFQAEIRFVDRPRHGRNRVGRGLSEPCVRRPGTGPRSGEY